MFEYGIVDDEGIWYMTRRRALFLRRMGYPVLVVLRCDRNAWSRRERRLRILSA